MDLTANLGQFEGNYDKNLDIYVKICYDSIKESFKEKTAMHCDGHIHLFPFMDNGPATPEEAAQMFRFLLTANIDTAICASHFDPQKEDVRSFLNRQKAAVFALRSVLKQDFSKISVIPSVEIPIFRGVSKVPDLERLCLPGTRFLPITLPLGAFTRETSDELIHLMHKRKLYPLICHIQRNTLFYSAEDIERLVTLPYAIYQIDVRTFSEQTNINAVTALLRNKKTLLLGSNAHNITTRSPDVLTGRLFFENKYGEAVFRILAKNSDNFIRSVSHAIR